MSRQTSNNPSGFWKTVLLFIIVGTAALMITPASAGTGVTIAAQGDQAYNLGEKVVFSGQNSDSDTTYLFLTGPNLEATGVKLTSPDKGAVSGNPDSFTVVKTQPDKTWEYAWYTANLKLDAGTYTVYAASQPKTEDQPGSDATAVGIIVKKPFITAGISSQDVVKGQPFSVTGTAEGMPPSVQIWILGDTYRLITKEPVSANATYEYQVSRERSASLPAGSYFLVVQHPMADNRFDFIVSGNNIRDQKQNYGTDIIRLTDTGNVADTLIAAISDRESHDTTYTNDTYTIVPFQVTDAGSSTH
jgi:hypothetical protein